MVEQCDKIKSAFGEKKVPASFLQDPFPKQEGKARLKNC